MLPEQLLNQVMIQTLAIILLNTLSWDNVSVQRAKQKANLMYKCVHKFTPVYLHNMFTGRTLYFDLHYTRQKLHLRNQELTTWNIASVSAELLYGMIFQRNFTLQNLQASWREALIHGFLHWTTTRQICKPVYRKFHRWWIFLHFNTGIFCVSNKVFIHFKLRG